MTLLIILIACRAELPVTTDDNIIGHDPEYGTAEVTVTDDVPTDTGDSAEVVEDTAVEEVDCVFELVTTGNGRLEVGNELQMALNQASPSGMIVPGYKTEVLRFNMSSLHPECDAIEFNYIRIAVSASDNVGTRWLENVGSMEVFDLTVDLTTPALVDEEITTYDDGTYAIAAPEGSLTIHAGETHTLSVVMDTTGASVEWDDALQAKTNNPFHIAGTDERASVTVGEDVTGMPLVF